MPDIYRAIRRPAYDDGRHPDASRNPKPRIKRLVSSGSFIPPCCSLFGAARSYPNPLGPPKGIAKPLATEDPSTL